MQPSVILIAGKQSPLREKVTGLVCDVDATIVALEDHRQAKSEIIRHRPSIALCIATGSSKNRGLKMLATIRKIDKSLPAIVVTDRSSETLAIAALRAGASDYVKTPFADSDFLSNLQELIRKKFLESNKRPPSGCKTFTVNEHMVGESPTMRDINDYIHKVAMTDSTVLITGETGTGKELAAELIHMRSQRAVNPMIRVNCAAMPQGLVESELFGYERGAFTGAVAAKAGKFEMADGGSLFLDEIGEMQPYAQAKILHCIESKAVNPLGGKAAVSVDIRVIAATNQNPEDLISEGRFREDLYYRLNVARLYLPPLRERREDIHALIDFGIRKLNRRFNCRVRGLKDEVIRLLLRYDWPGNVRELMNVLEGTFINMPNNRIAYADLPVYFKRKLKESQHLPSEERNRILEALLETNWNKSTAAAKLNWSRMTLYRKMTKYSIVENRKPSR